MLLLLGQAFEVEELGDAGPLLTFVPGGAHPRSLGQQSVLKGFVLFQFALEGGRVGLPAAEDLLQHGLVLNGDVGQLVGEVPVSDLLGAVVGVLHEVGERLEGHPGGVGRRLKGVAHGPEGRRGVTGHAGDLDRLGFVPLEVEGLADGDEGTVTQDGKDVLLTVAVVPARSDHAVAQHPAGAQTLRDGNAPAEGRRALSLHPLLLHYVPCTGGRAQNYGSRGGRIEELEPDAHGKGSVAEVIDARREYDLVALAQEARDVGQHHQFLLRDDLAAADDAAQLLVVGEKAEIPGG